MSKEYKSNEKIIHALSNISIKFDELGFVPTTLKDENYEYFVDWFKDEIKMIREESSKQEKQLAYLEAKLAEMERCAENNKKVALLVSAEHIAKIEQLEQQLAEKEKEIERLLIARELLLSDLYYARMDCEKTNRQVRELDKSCGSIINNLTTQIEELKKEKK